MYSVISAWLLSRFICLNIHAQPPLPLRSSFYLLELSLAIFIYSESHSDRLLPCPMTLMLHHTLLENTCRMIQQVTLEH